MSVLRWVTVGLLVLSALVLATAIGFLILKGDGQERRVYLEELAAEKRAVLFDLDHAELLKACREIMRSRDYGPGTTPWPMDMVPPANPLIPEAIRNLRPSIYADKDEIMIRFRLSNDAFGFVAFADNNRTPDNNAAGAYFAEIIPGLWYFENSKTPGVSLPRAPSREK